MDSEPEAAGPAGPDLDFLEWRVQERIFRRGRSHFRRGAVLSCRVTTEGIEGEVQGSRERPYRVRIRPGAEGDYAPECDCAYDWDPWCQHAVALALRHLEERKRAEGGSLQPDLNLNLLRRAPAFARELAPGSPNRPAPAGPPPPHPSAPLPPGDLESLDLASLLSPPRESPPDRGAEKAGIRFALEPDPGGLLVHVLTPAAGGLRPVKNLQSQLSPDFGATVRPDERCEMVLRYLAQHAAWEAEWGKGAREWHRVPYEKTGPLLHLLSCSDAVVAWPDGSPVRFPDEVLLLVLAVEAKDPETLALSHAWRSRAGEIAPAGIRVYPSYPGTPSWAWAGNAVYRVSREAARLAARLGGRQEVPVPEEDLPILALRLAPDPPYGLEVRLSEAVRVAARRGQPRPVLRMEVGRLRIRAELGFDYQGRRVDPDSPCPYIGPPLSEAGFRVWTERDLEEERGAAERLRSCGWRSEPGAEWVVEGDDALDFVAHHLAPLSATWEILGVERLRRLQPRPLSMNVTVGFGRGIDWFETAVDCRAGDQVLNLGDLARLLRNGRRYVRLNDGTYAEIPRERVERIWAALSELEAETEADDRFRLPGFYGPALLEALEDDGEIRVHARFRDFVERLRSFSGIEEVAPPAGLVAALRPYQVAGYRWLHFLQEFGLGGILADDMGLGKTVQTLTILQQRREVEGPAPSLVVAPASVVFNWQEEAARFTPGLSVLPLVGLDRHGRFDRIEDHDVVLTNYALLRRDIARLERVEFRHVVLDEAQNIKNPDSVTARASRRLRARHRLVLTGTPIENRLSELWSIFHFLMPGFLHGYARFQSEYERPIQVAQDRETETRLRRRIRPFILRRLKRHVEQDLPEKTETTAHCDLLPEQRALYREVLQLVRREVLAEVDRHGVGRSQICILSALLRLRQVCCHPGLMDLPIPPKRCVSAKFDAFRDLVEEIVSEGHRILVFSQFVRMLQIIREWLEGRGIAYEYLDGRTRDRQAHVRRFQQDEGIPLFLISLKAGGTGLNLTGADYVIHYDPWWNPAVEDQATDRAHRIGQTRNVLVYRLITRGTVEEKILDLQDRKRDLADGLLGVDRALGKVLTREDVEDLFRLEG